MAKAPAAAVKGRMYDQIICQLYANLTAGMSDANQPAEFSFKLSDVRDAMEQAFDKGLISRKIKNIADIKYTYDARRALPPELEKLGFLTWLQDGKGRYKFRRTRRRNLIRLPDDLESSPPTLRIPDQTPPFISSLLGNDEQASFTRARAAGLISTFLGFQAHHLQGHMRTTVSYGQIEIDEICAGLDQTVGSVGTLVPISGKGGQDMLSWTQALNLNTYGKEKAPKSGLAVRSLGLWRDPEETTWLVEFSPHTDIDQIEIVKIQRFVFVRD